MQGAVVKMLDLSNRFAVFDCKRKTIPLSRSGPLMSGVKKVDLEMTRVSWRPDLSSLLKEKAETHVVCECDAYITMQRQ